MAHAMKPHVERAQAIGKVYEQNWRDDELAPEGTSPYTGIPRHEFDRELHWKPNAVYSATPNITHARRLMRLGLPDRSGTDKSMASRTHS